MAFTSTIEYRISLGDGRWMTQGTFTTDTTGGDIETGLRNVESITLQHKGGSTVADKPSVNETIEPHTVKDGEKVTIVVTSGADGYWRATGWF